MRTFLPATCIAFLAVLAFGCSKPESEARRRADFEHQVKRVKDLRKEGKLADAISVCNEIIEEAPTKRYRAEALLERAELKIDLEDYAGALSDLSSVETNASNVARVHYLQGAAYNGLGVYPEALKTLTRALELSPGNPNVLFNRALTHYRLGFFDSAEADISEAIRVVPKDFALYWRRSGIHFERGDYDSSAQDLLQAIALKPEVVTPYRDYGLTQFFLGNHGVASNYFSKYAELGGKTESERKMLLGSCYFDAHDYPRAVQFSDAALTLDADCDVCYADRALAKYFQNDINGAFSDITQAIALAPTVGRRYQLRGILHLLRGSYDAACIDFNEQLALTPETEGGHEGGYIGLVGASILAGRPEEAVKALERASSRRLWRPQLWLWCRLLGVKTSKDYDEYVLQFSPQSWPHVLIRHYLGQASADEVLRRAAHPNPAVARQRLAEAHFYLGALLALKGDTEGAKKEFAESLKADQIKWPVCILAQRQLETNWFATLGRAKPD